MGPIQIRGKIHASFGQTEILKGKGNSLSFKIT